MPTETSSFAVAGVTVNVPTLERLLAIVEARLAAGQGAAVATLNLDHVVKLERDGAFRDAYAKHELVTADGFPIVWAGRAAGKAPTRTAGSDMIEPLMALAARAGYPVALVGATQETLDGAAEKLRARHNGLKVILTRAPARNFNPASQEADDILAAVAASGARLCFLALGAPKQEILAARGREAAPRTAFFSIGAGLDFITGDQQRAPAFFQRTNLEWAWRLCSNPGRLARRYFEAALVMPRVLIAAWRSR